MQFSLRWLFGAVAFVAIGCVSLVYASPLLSQILSALLFAFLMVFVLGAIYAGSSRRAFWTRCAIVGWSYVLSFTLVLFLGSHTGIPGGVAYPSTLSTEILGRIYRIVHGGSAPYTDLYTFALAGQALAAFAWSVAGGIMAGRFRRID